MKISSGCDQNRNETGDMLNILSQKIALVNLSAVGI